MMTLAAEIDSQDPLFEQLSVDKYNQHEGPAEMVFMDLETTAVVDNNEFAQMDAESLVRLSLLLLFDVVYP